MSMTIGKRILSGFAVCITITAALGLFTYTRIAAIDAHVATIAKKSLPGVACAGTIEANTYAAGGIVLQHILAESKQDMDSADAKMLAMTEGNTKAYKELEETLTTPNEHELFEAAKAARAEYAAARTKILNLSRDGKKKEAMEMYRTEFVPPFEKLLKMTIALNESNKKSADDSTVQIVSAVGNGKTGSVVGIALAILAGAVLATLITRAVNKALNRIAGTLAAGSQQTSSAAGQVSSSSQSLAQGASEQAAALEETTSALEEMASMTRKNSETAQQAAGLSSEAQRSAAKGNDAMNKMSTAINDIQKSASETAKIIKVIDEIAFQTNLLALNAAVEAARAGEAGKGFAVVAEEVRNLAMRSAEAAKNTAAMIEESVNNAKNGVTIAVEVGKNLEEITTAATKVNSLVGEIAAASKEQSQGIDQVNTAVSQMDKVTQSNAASAEESASAAEELSSQAIQLSEMVGELVALVGGATKSGADGNALQASPSRQPANKAGIAKGRAPSRKSPSLAIPLDDDERARKEDAFAEFGGAR